MSEWGWKVFGDPCRECGYSWSHTADELRLSVSLVPSAYAAALDGHEGSERMEALEWPAISYVCHVVDNLRIWAERLAASGTREVQITTYDNELLAKARNYTGVPLEGAL